MSHALGFCTGSLPRLQQYNNNTILFNTENCSRRSIEYRHFGAHSRNLRQVAGGGSLYLVYLP